MTRCNLPESITLPTGETLKPVFGGNLNGKPFLTTDWANGSSEGTINDRIVAEARRRKLKFRRISVLSRNLRGKLDLHHRPYRAIEYVLVQVS